MSIGRCCVALISGMNTGRLAAKSREGVLESRPEGRKGGQGNVWAEGLPDGYASQANRILKHAGLRPHFLRSAHLLRATSTAQCMPAALHHEASSAYASRAREGDGLQLPRAGGRDRERTLQLNTTPSTPNVQNCSLHNLVAVAGMPRMGHHPAWDPFRRYSSTVAQSPSGGMHHIRLT